MKIKRTKRGGFLETCASGDLAFLLIIYFLLIAGFNINQGFLINLPAQDSTKIVLTEDLLRFEMNESGEVIHEGHSLGFDGAADLISAARAANPNTAVTLTINAEAHWQNVVSFVELAQDMDIGFFSFSMKAEPQ